MSNYKISSTWPEKPPKYHEVVEIREIPELVGYKLALYDDPFSTTADAYILAPDGTRKVAIHGFFGMANVLTTLLTDDIMKDQIIKVVRES